MYGSNFYGSDVTSWFCFISQKLKKLQEAESLPFCPNDAEMLLKSFWTRHLQIMNGGDFISQNLKKLQQAESLPFCPTDAAIFL